MIKIERKKCLFCNETEYKKLLCKKHYDKLLFAINNIDKQKYNKYECKAYFHNLRYSIIKMVKLDNIVENMIKLYALAIIFSYYYKSAELQTRFDYVFNKYYYSKLRFNCEISEITSDLYSGKLNEEELRKKWPAKYICDDGHYVRSLSELIVDNWLFSNNILHVYEKIIYVSTDGAQSVIVCDFYIPSHDAYIEYWGKYDRNYLARKHSKRIFYKQNNYRLIEVEHKDLTNLEVALGKLKKRD